MHFKSERWSIFLGAYQPEGLRHLYMEHRPGAMEVAYGSAEEGAEPTAVQNYVIFNSRS